MTHLNSLYPLLEAEGYEGAFSDMLYAKMKSYGLDGATFDMVAKYFSTEPNGTVDDSIFQWLRSRGYGGSTMDMLYDFANGGNCCSQTDGNLIYDAPFGFDLKDRISGHVPTFERATNAVGELALHTYDVAINEPRYTNDGLLLEGQATNLVVTYKINPPDTTNLVSYADRGEMSVVDDADALKRQGFEMYGPNVFYLNNTSGTTMHIYFRSQDTLDLSKTYSESCIVRGTSFKMRLGAVYSEQFPASDEYVICKHEDVTPEATNNDFHITLVADEAVYVCMPQLEEGSVATSPVIGANTAATATRSTEQGVTNVTGLQFDMLDIPAAEAAKNSSGTAILNFVPNFDYDQIVAGGPSLVSWRETSRYSLLYFGLNGRIQASSDTPSTSVADYAFVAGEEVKATVTWEAGGNFQVTNNGVTGSAVAFSGWHESNDMVFHFANTMSINYKRFRIYDRVLTAEEIANA